MLVGYKENAPVTTRLIPFVVLSMVGAIYSLIFSFFGHYIYDGKNKNKK